MGGPRRRSRALTQLFTFEDDKTLPDIEAMAKGMSGELVALWSYKLACVANVDGNGPVPNYNPDSPPPPAKVRSSFAYFKAVELVAKQQLGPPATDLGWSQSIRGRFVEEWRAAQKPGVLFSAAVIHARGPASDAQTLLPAGSVDSCGGIPPQASTER